MDIGIGMVAVGFIFGVLGTGLLANNRFNAYILIGFGCLFGVGLIVVGASLIVKRIRGDNAI